MRASRPPTAHISTTRAIGEGGQHPILCRQPLDQSAPEQILIDGDAEADGHAYFDIGDYGHSPDQPAVRMDGRLERLGTVHASRPRPRNEHDARRHRTRLPRWLRMGQRQSDAVLQRSSDENHRPCKVCKHRLGTPHTDDGLVYEEHDAGFFVGIGKTESRRFLIIDAHDHVTSEARLIDADRPDSAPVLVAKRSPHVEYDVSHQGDRLIILTNADGAEDFKLVEAPLADPSRSNWRDCVPHRPGTLIIGVIAFAHYLVRLERSDGLPRLVVPRVGRWHRARHRGR